MTVHISKDTIPCAEAWEDMCLETGNFLQSRHYDTINAIYHNRSQYIYVTDDSGILLGGCRIFINESRRLPVWLKSISRSALQYGEYLISAHLESDTQYALIQLIHTGIKQVITDERISSMSVYGQYGRAEQLYTSQHMKNVTRFYVGVIDLTNNIETLWQNLHHKYRYKIRKAEKDNVTVVCDKDLDSVKKLLQHTYANQKNLNPPSDAFLDAYYANAIQTGDCYIYKVYFEDILCGAALIHAYGHRIEYAFGGSHKGHNGANNLMHWRIIQDMKAKGHTIYSLGEIADNRESYNNPKFEEGISRFKIGFGCILLPSYRVIVVIAPIKYTLWSALKKLFLNLSV